MESNMKPRILFRFIFISSETANEEMEAKYQFSIRKSNGEEVKIKSLLHKKIVDLKEGWGYIKLIKREELLNESNGYIHGDRLKIVCKMIVIQESAEKSHVEIPECRALEDVSYLFEKSLFPDCKITSEDDKEFKVHKCILGCRSPVFAAMFEHEMLEKNSNIIDISDMKGNVIEEMLRFIYSGKEPADLEVGMAADLLMAAEKYELIRLKLICERKLIDSLLNENACELLVLAKLHSAKHLKTKAIDFIKMNMNEVKESEGWVAILADKQLVEQILMAK